MGMEETVIRGRDAVASLAQRFPQLYVAPAEGAQEAHRLASGYGMAPVDASLDHFVTTGDDELRVVDTPAGPVEVLFLKERRDFETFLQIVGHKSRPDPISRTVGAITYRGIADWGKVHAAQAEYAAAGGDDWPAEFKRLASQPGAFRSELVVISEGPYSDIPASATSYGEDEWLRVSRGIRLHHECAHVVCRRLMPDDIAPVWDEITADVTGLICAIGRYDAALAALFLGVGPDGYTGGRLNEYLDDAQRADIDRFSRKVHAVLADVEQRSRHADLSRPFDFLLELKRSPLLQEAVRT